MSSNCVQRQPPSLRLLQRHLDRLYHTDLDASVDSFLIDDGTRRQLMQRGAISGRLSAREEVYVLEHEGTMALAVFIDTSAQEAVARVGANGTLELQAERFADFCVALEAVSHFLLLAHRAAGDTPVTQLELELQAEVDKYLAARLLTWRADSGPVPAEVREALFRSYRLDDTLDSEQRERYRTASQLAMRYCDFLERAFIRERRLLSLFRELRRFFRAGQRARIRHIDRAA